MTDRDLMQQALEALEFFWDNGYRNIATKQKATMNALRERLAQPEPVAWYFVRDLEKGISFAPDNDATKSWQPLYPALPAATEPVAWMVYTLDGKSVCVTDNPNDFTDQHKALPLYTAPRQWHGLTDEELEEMHNEIKVRLMGTYRTEDIYRIIEAKLRGKNT